MLLYWYGVKLNIEKMGVDVSFVTKRRDDNRIYKVLSRDFCYFISGPEAYGQDSELNQIEKIFNIDLKVLTQICDLTPPVHEFEYEEYVASENGDMKRLEEIKIEKEKFIKQWEENYDMDLSGWIPIGELEPLIRVFLVKFTSKIGAVQNLDFNFDWEDYFILLPTENQWENRLIGDLKELLVLSEEAKSIGEDYIGFYYE